ncbi:MAG: hypothetical protein KC910_20935, partial [Candidatus Eremiobacteraeota bacterium]|nr:hypothetical protein [Candidatus Eremiobacteraeota bacterium]
MFYSVSNNAATHNSARNRRDPKSPTVTSGATKLLDSHTAPPSKAGHGAGASWDLPVGFDPRPEVKAPEASSGFHKLASGAALALSVLGVGVGMVGAAAPAYAATSQALTDTRSQSPVTFSDANDVVSKFDGVHQLYVKGNNLSPAEMAKLQKILKDYPNIYVVLMDYTGNVESTDWTVSRGIGNSQAFQDVRNEVTGDKEAAVFMVYFDSNQGRKIFMRSEELPDKAGVGDPDFAVNGQPAKLLRTFLRARDAGKDFPGMLEDVFKEVDAGINSYVNNLVNGARDSISSAQSQLTSARQKVSDFQKTHGKNQTVGHPDLDGWSARLDRAKAALSAKDYAGARSLAQSLQRDIQSELSAMGSFEQTLSSAQQVVDQAERKLEEGKDAVKAFQHSQGKGGSLGSPDVAGWESQLKQAKEALGRGNFADARSLANNLVTTISIYRQNVAEFQAAQTTATAVEADLAKLQAELDTLPDNDKGQQARAFYAQAKEHFADYKRLHDGKENGYNTPLTAARQEVAEGLEQASASRAQAEATKKAMIIGSTAVTVGIVALGVFANYRARQKRKEANQALENATADISARTQALVALMDEADYQSIARYSGKTEKMAKDLIENVTDALTLVGGAEKFLSEAEALIKPKSFKNLFLTGNYDQGIALLTDPETRLDFNFEDSSRAVMDKGSKAESWRDELLRKGASREFKKSLYEVLLAMAEKRDTARGLLDEITSKNAEITKYLDSVETAAKEAEEHSRALQEAGQKDQLFTAPSVTENLLPMVTGPAEEGGLIARGRDIKESDPVRAWDEFATPAKRMTGDAENVVEVGGYSRGSLLPTL